MDRKKVREKQRAVKDAMKLQRTFDQLQSKAADAGKSGDPFAKFFGAMAGALGELVEQTKKDAGDESFKDLVDQPLADIDPEAFMTDLPFGGVDEDDDEMMEDEEDV